MDTAAKLSVVVATRDRPELLGELLDALERQTLGEPFEVIVVDDGSLTPAAPGHRPRLQLTVLTGERPEGPAAARNRGWRAAGGELICFTDDDCRPRPDWLERCLGAAAAAPGAIVQGRTLPREDQLELLGPLARTMRCERLDPNFPTTNLCFPRELLDELGGFDERRYAGVVGGEDTDLVWRALAQGRQVVFHPEPTVEHVVDPVGLRGAIKIASRRSALRPFVDHPRLRGELFVGGLFRKRTHAELLVALLGLVAATRRPWALALAAPYLRTLRARGAIRLAPALVVIDAAEVVATVRAGFEDRTPML